MNACLIMGHKNPLQIIRLARQLIKNKKNDVFIHLDSSMSKKDIQQVNKFCAENGEVHLCSKRIHGVLDRRSLVDIVFIMISEAKEVEKCKNKHYEYYLLLSGQDYLVKNINYINDELTKNYPKPYIDCTPYDRDNWIYHKFVYCKMSILYNDWITRHFSKGLIRSALRASAIIFTKILSIIRKDSYSKLNQENILIYGGSAWWILPDIIIEYITDKYNNKDKVSELILNESSTPEETYFQSMSMMSPFSNMIEVNPKDMVLQNCKTWAYFFDEEKPFKGHPYIFTVKEYDKLKECDFWFARKFDMTIDEEILDKLDSING